MSEEENQQSQSRESNARRSSNTTAIAKKKSRYDLKREDVADPLTPIREFEENEEPNLLSPSGKASRSSNEYVKSYINLMKSRKTAVKEVSNCTLNYIVKTT